MLSAFREKCRSLLRGRRGHHGLAKVGKLYCSPAARCRQWGSAEAEAEAATVRLRLSYSYRHTKCQVKAAQAYWGKKKKKKQPPVLCHIWWNQSTNKQEADPLTSLNDIPLICIKNQKYMKQINKLWRNIIGGKNAKGNKRNA